MSPANDNRGDARPVEGPVTVYESEVQRFAAHASIIASAAIQESWAWHTERSPVAPGRASQLETALALLANAELETRKRLSAEPNYGDDGS